MTLERLNARDRRFIGACLGMIAVGALVTAVLFRRAFPEAQIEFRVNRGQARQLGEKLLAERKRSIVGAHFAGRFTVEDDPKVYLERELGLEKAGALYGTTARVWRWEMRWYRSAVKEEERVTVTPLGDVVGFESVRRDDAPGPRPAQSEARALATAFLAGRGLPESAWKPIEATPISRAQRTDWKFVDERLGVRMGDATVRYETTVSGGEVSAFQEFVHVPEAWQRDYARLRSKNETAGTLATLGLFVTLVAMIFVLVRKIVLRDVRWKLVAAFGIVGFVLSLLSEWNEIPLTLFHYDTASPLSSFLTNRILLGFFGAIAVGAGLAFVMAAAEPIYRERFPAQPALSRLFSGRGIRSKRFFLGVLLGYALVAFFFAYQAVFYVVAARFGAWSPADVPYSDMLSTAVPWATVLFIGFLPAVSEEGISRLFSISFLDRLAAGRLAALVIPALIWGFGHAAYPNQPFYIRGVEVGLAGVLIGGVMLRFGALPLLVWHFTVDAIYTALLMLRSKNAYYVTSGAIAAGILLLPLAVALIRYLREGGFISEAGLTNADEGFVPAPPPSGAAPEDVPEVRPLPAWARWGGLAVALLLAGGFAFKSGPVSDLARDRTGRERAEQIARAFLRANGVAPGELRSVAYPGSGFPEAEDVREQHPDENGLIPGFSAAAARYVLEHGGLPALERLSAREVPVALWAVRFFRPEKKEEWKVLIDARRGRVIGFVHPIEEATPEPGRLESDGARRRAFAAAAALGYPSDAYRVADVGTEDRPKRQDTIVVLESRPKGIGEARPRLTAVFHGRRLASFLPSIQIPEKFLRQYRSRSVADWFLLSLRILAIGSLAGVAVILFLRLVRGTSFPWRSIRMPLVLTAVLAAAAIANRLPEVYRRYPTETPLRLFFISVAVTFVIAWIFQLLVAGVGFVLFRGARPGWRRAVRRKGRLGDAVFRALVAAGGLAGVAHLSAVAATRYPALFEPDVSLPSGLAAAYPSLAIFWSAARGAFGVAAVAAGAALAARQAFFRRPLGAALGIAAFLLATLPFEFASPGQFAAAYLPDVAALVWLAFCAFVLLADHAAAWVLFGALAFGGPAVADLLVQGAAEDRAAGWGALVLTVAAAVAWIAGRRDRSEPAFPARSPETAPLAPVA